MFYKLSLFAIVAPLVSALTLQVPENPTSGGSITIKWSSAQNDPDTWSFELTNTIFNQDFAIANNVNPTAGELTLTLPIVPVGDGYTLQAVNIGDVNDVFAATPDFSIGATSSSTSSSSSTPGATSSSSASVSGSSKTGVTTPASSSTPAVTSNSATVNSVTPGTSTPSPTTPSTSAPAGATPFSGALTSRLGSGPVGGIAVVLLSAAAGAAMIAL